MEMEWKRVASMEYGKIVYHAITYHALLMTCPARLVNNTLQAYQHFQSYVFLFSFVNRIFEIQSLDFTYMSCRSRKCKDFWKVLLSPALEFWKKFLYFR